MKKFFNNFKTPSSLFIFILLFFLNFLATSRSLWDLSSLTRDQTLGSGSESIKS